MEAPLLANLFIQTIKFFDTIAQPSSGLMVDRNILIGLARDLDLVRPDEFDPVTTSSFSSSASQHGGGGGGGGGPLPPMQQNPDNYVPSSPAIYAQPPPQPSPLAQQPQQPFAPPPPQANQANHTNS